MFPDAIAIVIGVRLQAVTQRMNLILDQAALSPEFSAILRQTLHLPNKLGSVPAAQGQPLRRQDRYLWSVPVVVAHAVVTGVVAESAILSSWQTVIGMAASAEYLGLATDLLDDIQDGDSAFVHGLGTAVALNCVLTLWEMAHVALDDEHLTADMRNRLLRLLTTQLIQAGDGQFLDIAYEQRQQVTVDEALAMTVLKSGALMSLLYASGALIGATQTARSEDEIAALTDVFATLGRHVGTLMQLVNDEQDARLGAEQPKSDRSRQKKTPPLVAEETFAPADREEGRERFMRLLMTQQRGLIIQDLERIATDFELSTDWLRWLLEIA